MTDEMPARGTSNLWLLGARFLNPVLSDVRDAGGDGFFDPFGGKSLGDSHQGHLRALAPGAITGVHDALLYSREIVSDRHGVSRPTARPPDQRPDSRDDRPLCCRRAMYGGSRSAENGRPASGLWRRAARDSDVSLETCRASGSPAVASPK